MKRSFPREDAGTASPETLSAIVKNRIIRTFLETNDKRYIVGSKGSGKTLLLLRKAVDQRTLGDGLCIPSDHANPVDRLTADIHVGKRFNHRYRDENAANLAWATVWKHSIFRSVLHHMQDQVLAQDTRSPAPDEPGWLGTLRSAQQKELANAFQRYIPPFAPVPLGPFHYFTELGARLDSAGHQAIDRVNGDLLILNSLLKLFRQPVYIFLDNLDDYYELEPELWYNSMYGQLRAVREISLEHRSIHVFTSIRQDVFEQFAGEMRLQYYDYAARLSYTDDELLEIFRTSIAELDDELLMRPDLRRSDPWHAFFGDCVVIENERIGAAESVQGFILRHTLRRPRDLIHVGTVLLEQRPLAGFTADVLRRAVHKAQREIAMQYLAETRPLLDPRFDMHEFVSRFVPGEMLTHRDIRSATDDYLLSRDEVPNPNIPSDLTRPFETLWALGLLGRAYCPPDMVTPVQKFETPGQGLPDVTDRSLPESAAYFLHPVLRGLALSASRVSDVLIGEGLQAAPVDT